MCRTWSSLDTLKSSPPEKRAMKKASLTGVTITTLFYALCGLLGYAAFGNKAPGNFLTGFGFCEPYWLVDIGNISSLFIWCEPTRYLVNPCFNLWKIGLGSVGCKAI